jgi:hypothetical protein
MPEQRCVWGGSRRGSSSNIAHRYFSREVIEFGVELWICPLIHQAERARSGLTLLIAWRRCGHIRAPRLPVELRAHEMACGRGGASWNGDASKALLIWQRCMSESILLCAPRQLPEIRKLFGLRHPPLGYLGTDAVPVYGERLVLLRGPSPNRVTDSSRSSHRAWDPARISDALPEEEECVQMLALVASGGCTRSRF